MRRRKEEQLIGLIKQNKVKDVLIILEQELKGTSLYQETLHLLSRYERVQKSNRLATRSFPEINQENNRIVNSILHLIEEASDKNGISNKTVNSKINISILELSEKVEVDANATDVKEENLKEEISESTRIVHKPNFNIFWIFMLIVIILTAIIFFVYLT